MCRKVQHSCFIGEPSWGMCFMYARIPDIKNVKDQWTYMRYFQFTSNCYLCRTTSKLHTNVGLVTYFLWYNWDIYNDDFTVFDTNRARIFDNIFVFDIIHVYIQSNLVNKTLVYTTPSILRHIFARPSFLVQSSLCYTTTTHDNATFRIYVLSY